MCGALCVMTPGETLMLLLYVDNWAIPLKVRNKPFSASVQRLLQLTLICFLSTDAVAFSNAHFGAGTGTIYLDNVGCTGTESNLIDCTRSSTVICSSGHSEDAGVRCQGKSET